MKPPSEWLSDNDLDQLSCKSLSAPPQWDEGMAQGITAEIDQSHNSHNAPVPYPTMHRSEQKCAHFCSELWDMGQAHRGICELGLFCK